MERHRPFWTEWCSFSLRKTEASFLQIPYRRSLTTTKVTSRDRELWHFYKIYFNAINQGNKKLNIPEYNGGLFATDDLLDAIVIDNDVIEGCPLALSAYDFNSDIDVNISWGTSLRTLSMTLKS